MSTRTLLSCFLALTVFAASASGHKDARIELHGTTLVGLPNKYSPAQLDLKTLRLRIRNHAMEFSGLLKSFFDEPYDLEVSSSWYHDPDILPPYLSLAIHPKKKDFSYEVLFALDTLRVIEVTVVLRESESTTRLLPIALSESQKKDMRDSIRKAQ